MITIGLFKFAHISWTDHVRTHFVLCGFSGWYKMADPSWGWNEDNSHTAGYNAAQNWQQTNKPWAGHASYRLVCIMSVCFLMG